MPRFFRSRTRNSDPQAAEPESHEPVTHRTAAQRLLHLQQTVGNDAVQGVVASVNKRAAGDSGEPIAKEVREPLEQSLGADLSEVRLHTGASAAESARSVDANAYAKGRDIYFAAGKYAPETPEGRHLLAHELTHVIQQDKTPGIPAFSNELSDPSDLAEREAEAVADATERGERIPSVVSTGKGIQRDVGWAKRGPLPDPYGTLLLLNAFAAKFMDAATLIHQNPAAMKLVNEAEAAGIEFGGCAEDGPGKLAGRAYTSGTKVYVPKTQTDSRMAMRDFLFELNNALRAPRFADLIKEAVKGSKGTLTAKQYAYQVVEQEVEGMLRLGEIWFETRKTMPRGAGTDAYDAPYFLPDYETVKSGKKSKDDLVKDVLKRVYDTGSLKGKTVEQNYAEQYESISGGK